MSLLNLDETKDISLDQALKHITQSVFESTEIIDYLEQQGKLKPCSISHLRLNIAHYAATQIRTFWTNQKEIDEHVQGLMNRCKRRKAHVKNSETRKNRST